MTSEVPPLTIEKTIHKFLQSVEISRSANTLRTYRNGMNLFVSVLTEKGINPDTAPLSDLSEDAIAWFAAAMKSEAPTTERVYLTAATRLYEFIAGENLANINLPRVRLLIHQRARQPGVRLPQFPKQSIEAVLDYAETLAGIPCEDPQDHLRNLRDWAFMITLADTGLRVHEACNLRRGDIDPFEGKAVIIGKGNRQAVVRFSGRSLAAIKIYLRARMTLDGASKRSLGSLPLFARHDRGAGKRVKPITTKTGRDIVAQRVREALGEEAVGTITPHSFRHYFVTVVLQSSGNLKLAQELARHQSITVTQRYAHLNDDELDKGYGEIFDQK
ncbi:MAG TPA: tyrosine-type recombinase/integrase [Anaerolineaceae bacterium]|nr:tyrosine-type recombinase/integrase [Anaerolineaceae bacterium]